MTRRMGMYMECHGQHWVDDSDDTVEDASVYDLSGETYTEGHDDAYCEVCDDDVCECDKTGETI